MEVLRARATSKDSRRLDSAAESEQAQIVGLLKRLVKRLTPLSDCGGDDAACAMLLVCWGVRA